jgi:hypothetical protein
MVVFSIWSDVSEEHGSPVGHDKTAAGSSRIPRNENRKENMSVGYTTDTTEPIYSLGKSALFHSLLYHHPKSASDLASNSSLCSVSPHLIGRQASTAHGNRASLQRQARLSFLSRQ